MYKVTLLRAIFLIFAGLHLSACHLVQQLDGMAANTKDLKSGTDQVRQTSDELYDALRQGSSLQLRTQLFKNLLESESTGHKVANGVHYLMAFEFQLYTGFAQDTNLEKREKFMAEATQEFFMTLKDVYIVSDQVSPLSQGDSKNIYSNANKEATFNAISLGLHMLNRKQEENLKKNPGMEAVSMYSMIQSSLLLEKELNQGKITIQEMPEYSRYVLNNKRMAIKLLQARQMMIKMVFLSETSPLLEGRSKVSKMLNFASMNIAGWDLNLENLTATQVREFNIYFELREKTINLLSHLRIPVQNNRWIERLIQKMQVPEIKDSGDSERSQLGITLIALKN